MNPANVSLLHALVLIGVGLAGYFTSESPSLTAFIPVVFGAVILACNPGLRKNNKIIAHVAVGLTLVILLSLGMPLKGAISRGETAPIARVTLMLVVTMFSLVVFIRSFIALRKSRTTEAVSEPSTGSEG
ncbi:MAG: hypothetical protein AAF745_15300 [Planctomycetota bacterium]